MADVWERILYALAIATMSIGNLFAIRQQNLKRFLAFSSIAQAGFILLGIIEGGSLGMTAVVYFMIIYIFSNLGAFGVISSVYYFTGKENRDDYNGFYLTNPKLSLIMLISLFSLAGIPPVAGFFGKFFLFAAAASKGYYVLVLIATINAVVSLYYYLLVVKAMFINKSDQPIEHIESNPYMKFSLVICTVGIVMIGILSMIYEHIFSLSTI
jgi:NADH-quinone oxidoreductase subunit N